MSVWGDRDHGPARLRWVALACLFGATAIACSGSDDDVAADLDTADTDAVPLAAVVGVRAEGCGAVDRIGSGVAVSEVGLVATVAHTVAGADSVEVIDASGAAHEATIVAFDPAADLAALEIPTLDVEPLTIGVAATGSVSIARWDPDAGVSSSSAAVTRRLGITIEDIFGDVEIRRTGLELEADIAVGDSGGPVIDAEGAVIGIVYANSRSRPRTGFATDDAELRSLLATVGDDVVGIDRCV